MNVFHRTFAGASIAPQLRSAEMREAYDYFRAAAAESGGPPRLSDLITALGHGLLPWAALATRLPDGDFEFLFMGESVQRFTTVPFMGRRVAELSPRLRSVYRDVFQDVLDTDKPVFTVHSAQHSATVNMWERLVLPVRSAGDGRHILVIYAPHNFKNDLIGAAFEATTDAILGLDPVFGPDGRVREASVVVANRAAHRLFAEDALLGRPARKLFDDVFGLDLFDTIVETYAAGAPAAYTVTDPMGRGFRMSIATVQLGIVVTLAAVEAAAA